MFRASARQAGRCRALWLQSEVATAKNSRIISVFGVAHNFRSVNGFRVRDPQQHRHVVRTEGNFKEYDADLRRRKGADADQPHRVTYKKLVRS